MDREKVIKSIKWLRDKPSWREGIMIHDDHAEVRKRICEDALALLKEQEAEIRQLRLALDIAKGTCKGITFETDEKFMGDL